MRQQELEDAWLKLKLLTIPSQMPATGKAMETTWAWGMKTNTLFLHFLWLNSGIKSQAWEREGYGKGEVLG